MGFINKLHDAWNVLRNKGPETYPIGSYGEDVSAVGLLTSGRNSNRGVDRSALNILYSRIAIDVSLKDCYHVQTDKQERFVSVIQGNLNTCLSFSANIDQTADWFWRDATLTMFDDGCVVLVPCSANMDPEKTDSASFSSLRVGKLKRARSTELLVEIWDDQRCMRREVWVSKSVAVLVQNPFYEVMNAPDSIVQSIIKKFDQLDRIDNAITQDKLNIIIQFPQPLRTPARIAQAEDRLNAIETQLTNSPHGIAYIDSTEKVIQLNRPLDNTLLDEIEYLTKLAYSRLGLTEEIINGTATPEAMLNYETGTVKPILRAYQLGMSRTWLSRKAYGLGQRIMWLSDPFENMPPGQIASMAETVTRNEIMSPNEVRQKMGLKPSPNPDADELRNRNLSQSNAEIEAKGQGPADTGDDSTQELLKTLSK